MQPRWVLKYFIEYSAHTSIVRTPYWVPKQL